MQCDASFVRKSMHFIHCMTAWQRIKIYVIPDIVQIFAHFCAEPRFARNRAKISTEILKFCGRCADFLFSRRQSARKFVSAKISTNKVTWLVIGYLGAGNFHIHPRINMCLPFWGSHHRVQLQWQSFSTWPYPHRIVQHLETEARINFKCLFCQGVRYAPKFVLVTERKKVRPFYKHCWRGLNKIIYGK